MENRRFWWDVDPGTFRSCSAFLGLWVARRMAGGTRVGRRTPPRELECVRLARAVGTFLETRRRARVTHTGPSRVLADGLRRAFEYALLA